ncbi:MAG: hypothetical protein KDK36_08375, partial [Leptospiraceae bacterium]|nr:hypothetical protein [Leptospiraceae bacterium]
SSLDKKDPKDPADKDIVDISVEFGKGSHNQIRHDEDREAPYVGRGYNPKEYHYRLYKDQIEGSVAVGYKLLGQAKNAKLDALKIERHLEKHQKLMPQHRKYRIERYLEVIARCREARMSAMNIFRLKYMYDNEYLQTDEKVELEGVSNVNRINPYMTPKKLSPVFDNRIPVAYRRDAVDTQGLVFFEEVNQKIRLERTDVDSINRLLEKYGEKQKLEKPPEKAKASGDSSKDASGKSATDKQPTPPPAK